MNHRRDIQLLPTPAMRGANAEASVGDAVAAAARRPHHVRRVTSLQTDENALEGALQGLAEVAARWRRDAA